MRAAGDLAAFARSNSAAIPVFLRLPFCEPRANHDRLDEQHDLVAVGVVRAELGTLAGVEPALEQRSEDRRVDFRPVQHRRAERDIDLGFVQR